MENNNCFIKQSKEEQNAKFIKSFTSQEILTQGNRFFLKENSACPELTTQNVDRKFIVSLSRMTFQLAMNILPLNPYEKSFLRQERNRESRLLNTRKTREKVGREHNQDTRDVCLLTDTKCNLEQTKRDLESEIEYYKKQLNRLDTPLPALCYKT